MQLKALVTASALALLVGAPAVQAASHGGAFLQHAQYYDNDPYDDEDDDNGRVYEERGYDRADVPRYGYRHGYRVRISCERGARIVDYQGFYRVQPRDCDAPIYGYRAWRHGRPYFVRLNARSGNILSAQPIWR